MKITDIKIDEIIKNIDLNNKFISTKHEDLNLNCDILTKDFYLDSQNYYPISPEYFTFLDLFRSSKESNYNNFYTKNFLSKFKNNITDFKVLSNIFVLGSSPVDNYYRNLITFFPRLFFTKEKKIKVAVHRNSSNKYRNFIKIISAKMNVEIQFVFLDDGFYNFHNSQMPQFFLKDDSIKILNNLRSKKKLGDDKIYLTRRNCNYRNLINEPDVIELLKKFNFRIVDMNDYNIFEQIDIFSKAKIVIGPTGSSFANIVFCNKKTIIVEIAPKYKFKYEKTFKYRYKEIAETLNLNYHSIEADSINLSGNNLNKQKAIIREVFEESNYYKNLIIKLDKLKKLDFLKD